MRAVICHVIPIRLKNVVDVHAPCRALRTRYFTEIYFHVEHHRLCFRAQKIRTCPRE